MIRRLSSTARKLWEVVQYSYWVIPAVMTIAAVLMAFGLLQLDRIEGEGLVERLGWVYTGGSDGAREVLAVVAASMITVAGVVFSITMVALTLASSQFGPRVLRNFMQDRGSQFVLGTFIATFVYSLTILRSIRGGDDGFVPQLSVTVSFVLALVSLGVLIYFIHHVALSIQGTQIVKTIGEELLHSVDRTFPESSEDAGDGGGMRAEALHEEERPEEDAVVLAAKHIGYIQEIDHDALVSAAAEVDVVLQLLAGPGSFVSPYKPVMLCRPASSFGEELEEALQQALTTGSERSHTQDVLFAVDQLVEVAIRALSPGINDPFTAIRCLDWLGAALARCLLRPPAPFYRLDAEGELRLIWNPLTFDDMIDSALLQIQEYGRRSTAVTAYILDVLTDLARHATTERQQDAVRRHADQVLEVSRKEFIQDPEREGIRRRYEEVVRILRGDAALRPEPDPG